MGGCGDGNPVLWVGVVSGDGMTVMWVGVVMVPQCMQYWWWVWLVVSGDSVVQFGVVSAQL